ncbi:MAG: cytochrome b [Mariprofundaceae bacterium]|nr:cytochrome b [Mariprofundaceae bacterium]
MLLRNNTQHYGWLSIIIHWSMALLIFAMFALGWLMVELNYGDIWYHKAPWIHQSVGILLFFLLIFRLFWRLINPLPALYGATWEKNIGLWVHKSHYVWMLAVICSGYLISTADGRGIEVFTWFEVPALLAAEKGRESVAGWWHMLLAWCFMGFVLLHASAAFKHHFIDKDNTLLRMLGITKDK